MKMPEKDPSNWQWLIEQFTPEVRAAIMAGIIALLRIVYDRKESKWQRIGLESLLCGAIAYGLSSGLSWFDVPTGVSVFVGSAVGFLGVDFVRAKANDLVDKKIDKAGR